MTSFPVTLWNPWICLVDSMVNDIFRSPNPKGRKREFHPCVNQQQERERQVQLLLNCVKQMSASCTSNLFAQMFDLRKYTRDHLMLTLSLQSLLQNQNLETVLICIVVLCSPHHNTTFITSLVHVVTARANLFTFRTICEQTVDNSPTDPISSSLN